MILNLSSSFSDIKLTADYFHLDLEKELIIDCSQLIKLQTQNFFSVCEIEDFENINEKSTREYIQEIGKLSLAQNRNSNSIRDAKILEHNLFWLTALAGKHPGRSLGKLLYLLDNILPLLKVKFDSNIYISIPRDSIQYIQIIKWILSKHGVVNYRFIKKHQPLFVPFIKSIIKLLYFYLNCILLFTSKRSANKQPYTNNFLITHTRSRLDENYSDFFLGELKSFSSSISTATYWPVFLGFKPLKQSERLLTKEYKSALPAFFQVGKLILDSCRVFLSFRWRVLDTKTAFFSDKKLINFEIKNAVIQNLHNIFYGCWLKNYFFNQDHEINLIYQDEFYETGRIISKVFENNNTVNTIGLQHGLFDLHHTVYGISEMELSHKLPDSLPAPHVFVVWGNFFKDYFLSNNNSKDIKFKILGNPKYINLNNTIVIQPGRVKKILWCTDTPELTLNDKILIETLILKNPEFEITVRMHPLYNFLKQYQEDLKLFNVFPNLKLSVGKSITDDIQNHDLVIVNSFTTAFVDAFLHGKYCFRLFPYTNSPAYLKNFNNPLIFNIFSETDLSTALKKIEYSEVCISLNESSKEIMDIDIEGWKQLITPKLSKQEFAN